MSVRAALAIALLGGAVAARELGESVALRTSLKSSALISHAPEDPLLFPERDGAAALWRLRFDLQGRVGDEATLSLAWEPRLRVVSAGALGGSGILPPESPAPYRLTQLDWSIAEDGRGFRARHEIDRALLALHLGRAEVTLGRQAVGWGRGVLFGAVDLFAPFTPLEADREWRRGVDAVRADLRLADRLSLDAVAAGGSSADQSAVAARLRGFSGDVDGELIAGWRARDWMLGLTSSAAIGDAELHAEAALFRSPDPLPAGGQLGSDRIALKAVAGGSIRVAVGNGVLLVAEYHYSGFGAPDASRIPALLLDPRFAERQARGDTQILGRHAVALLASSEISQELTVTATCLATPADGSGLCAPGAQYTPGSSVAVSASLYLPFGARPQGLELRSEYGAAPLSAFLQIRIDD